MKKEQFFAAALAASMFIPGSQILRADEQPGATESGIEEPGNLQTDGTGTSFDGTQTANEQPGTPDTASTATGVTDDGSVGSGQTGNGESGTQGESAGVPGTDANTGALADDQRPKQPAAPDNSWIADQGCIIEFINPDSTKEEKQQPLSAEDIDPGNVFWSEQEGRWKYNVGINGPKIAASLGCEAAEGFPGFYWYDSATESWQVEGLPSLTLIRGEKKPAPTQTPTLEELGLRHFASVTGPGLGLGDIKPGTVTIAPPQTVDGRTFGTATIDASQYPIGSRLPTEGSTTTITYFWNGYEWKLEGGFRLVYDMNTPGTLKPTTPGKLPSLEELYLNTVLIRNPLNGAMDIRDIIPGTVTLSEIKRAPDGMAYVTATLDPSAYRNQDGKLPAPLISTTQVQVYWDGYNWIRQGDFVLSYPFTTTAPAAKPAESDLNLFLTIRQGDEYDRKEILPGSVTVSDMKTSDDGIQYVTVTLDPAKYEKDGLLPSEILSRTALNFYWTDDGWSNANGSFVLVYPLEGAGLPDSGEENKPGTGEENKPGAGEDSNPGTGNGSGAESGSDSQTGSGTATKPAKDKNKPGKTGTVKSSSTVSTGVLSMTGLWAASAAVAAAMTAWFKKKQK